MISGKEIGYLMKIKSQRPLDNIFPCLHNKERNRTCNEL